MPDSRPSRLSRFITAVGVLALAASIGYTAYLALENHDLRIKAHYYKMVTNVLHEENESVKDGLWFARELETCTTEQAKLLEDQVEVMGDLVTCQEELSACLEAATPPP